MLYVLQHYNNRFKSMRCCTIDRLVMLEFEYDSFGRNHFSREVLQSLR